ncbi:phosphoserine transaminase [Rhabdobacter roseus]|uniref:phosphoserine transaminase n=1 Tax=Rhabdobacter roseus TaxID=1655419 RepID=A0A840U3X0_9BACT|nr:aminotransferase class V-fold PLP-dependent enzyme [Rhabdobacter roseus]MBB5286539.1 phosphoserine aminotransferase [Rhabdobacter roseus]
MITFYPGPSKIYPQVEQYLADAYRSGILSMNHRSAAFMTMLEGTLAALREKLAIPASYEVYLTSSATEGWEIVAQSLVARRSLHLYNGAFGEKWYAYTRRLRAEAVGLPFDFQTLPDPQAPGTYPDAEVLCLTHNETSNGTALPDASLRALRGYFAGLIAIDATSSMAGVATDWLLGDVWLASVQKCFGLPPGLGVLVVSPRAVARAEERAERNHYNSLLFLRENFIQNQTPYTPNTLAIYLLGRVMQQVPPLAEVDAETHRRAADWYAFLAAQGFGLLVTEPDVRSPTVVVVQSTPAEVTRLKAAASEAGIVVGSGYGTWKATTFRMANFPAITLSEIEQFQTFLRKRSWEQHE